MSARRPGSSHEDAAHVPVLGEAIVEALRVAIDSATESGPGDEAWILDGTVGLGGHAAMLLESIPAANVIGFDQDPEALEIARRNLSRFGARARVRTGRLSQLSQLARKEPIGRIVGVLFDLGVSSLQLDRADRGFSFQQDGPLDMRMDPTRDRTAAEIVNHWDESDLADLFYYEGGETRARPVARAIAESRRRAPFLRTGALADTITSALGSSSVVAKIHPATRVFQALRRAVNEEGEELLAGLAAAEEILVEGGRLAAISFHSGEDREVKRFLADGARDGRFSVLTRKPVEASEDERRRNPRSRSAKLRVAVRKGSPAKTTKPGGSTS
jgi:16S rRNA (cytosine1402-N4)-methyltransferase